MVMSQLCWLFVPFLGGELPLGGEACLLGYGEGPCNVQRCKHKVGFHNRGAQWDTPMARWAGKGNDWIKFMAQRKPRMEDEIRSMLEFMKEAVEKKTEPNGTRPTKKPRDLPLPPLELEKLEAGELADSEIKGECKTIVDWVNGHAKLKTRVSTVATTHNLLREWWCRGIRLRQQTADWSTHVFREHNKETDLCGDKAAKGRVEEWVDTAQVVWSEVTGLWVLGWQVRQGELWSRHMYHCSFGSTGLVSNLQEMRAASGHQLLGCRAGGEVWYAGG